MKPLRGLAEYVLHTVKRLLQALIIRVEPIGQACNVLPSGLELFLGLLERAAQQPVNAAAIPKGRST